MDKTIFFKTFSSFGLIQLTNSIFPLIILTFLTKIISVDNIGLVFFTLSIHQFLSLIIDYGYNVSAPKEIILTKDKNEVIKKVYFTKFFLFIVVLFVFIFIIIFSNKFSDNKSLYLLSCFYLIGNVILPLWYFQAIEKVGIISFFNLLSKSISLLIIILFITSNSQFIYIIPALAIGNIVFGILSSHKMIKLEKVNIIEIGGFNYIKIIKNDLINGFAYFINNLSSYFLTGFNLIIIGIYSSDYVTGEYAIVDRLINAIWQVLIVFSLTMFPRVCNYVANKESIRPLIYKIYMPFLLLIIFICLFIFQFPEIIIIKILGYDSNPQMISLLKIMSFIPIATCLNIPFSQILLAKGYIKVHSIVLLFVATLNIILLPIIVNNYGVHGVAWLYLSIMLILSASLAITFLYLRSMKPTMK